MSTDKKLKANGTGKLLLGDSVVVDQNTDRLGVGTTSPGTDLHVKAPSGTTTLLLDAAAGGADSRIAFSEGNGTSNITFDLLFEGSAGVSPNNLFKLRASSTATGTMDVDAVTVKQNGNVGIGTSSPSGGVSGNERFLAIEDDNVAGISFDTTGGATDTKWSTYTLNSNGSYNIRNVDGAVTAFTVLPTGAVTLGPSSGLTSPHIIQAAVDRTSISNIGVENADLHIKNTRTSAAGERTTIRFDQGGIIKAMLAVKNVGGGTGSSFEFYTRDSGNVTKLGLEIGQTGAVTLGPSGGLITHISNGAISATRTEAAGIQIFTGTNLSTSASASTQLALISNAGTAVFIKNSSANSSGAVEALRIINESGGVYLAVGGTSWSAISDMRHKTKVADLGSVLEGIKTLDVFTYQMNESLEYGKAPIELGLSAQQMLGVAPEIVNGSEDTQYSISYDRLAVVLVKALQELAAKVEALEAAAP